jgi:fructosamine-3-kinase
VKIVEDLGSSHAWNLHRAVLPDGRQAFVKTGGVSRLFTSEAAGLRWLGEAGAVTVPEVIEATDDRLVLDWIVTGDATAEVAERFGHELARLHQSGAAGFGAPWPGFIADLPMDNTMADDPRDHSGGDPRDNLGNRLRGDSGGDPRDTPGGNSGGESRGDSGGDPRDTLGNHLRGDSDLRGDSGHLGGRVTDTGTGDNTRDTPLNGLDDTPAGGWPEFYASRRLLPFVRRARDAGRLTAADAALLDEVIEWLPELAGPPEPPARIHGDLWSGNLLWTPARAVLVDPAAHGGHRETDLAMLALFGAPHLNTILAAYQEETPLADGWRARVPLHQLHPLLVHVCLFGDAYRDSLLAAAAGTLEII